MQTLPCGHRVVCRKCFIRTIQSAIADHSLPLKCIVCRASVLKLGSWKKVEKASSMASSSSAAAATPSKSARRTTSSLSTRVPHPRGTTADSAAAASKGSAAGTAAERPLSRSVDVGRPPEISSTAPRPSDGSSHRSSHRGCCHHHQIPLRQPSGHQDAGTSAAVGAGGNKITKLQPLPIYPARGSEPTQRRAFSSTAAAPVEATTSTTDAVDCAASAVGHRAS